ncbi:3-hydroxyacyl-CoA dehydrogenase NAD-binding domain-containing protein [Neomicrococcus aestuarii]|uniref:3-hydroxyacyl-CoA dehydrogenase n=1 Tax=Neomicrococcus aestuarii TaxID=556325 RepID=A0A1L2ZKQ7_9MICC|nr:3-hydroxyacyl-CoA dehydrogenase NAD-binding domain-containing protein [Neomicrococcus aestuarii]APF39790.1 3-hydroxyacyl-CoA dehydrogenase [Neomicrococcus aestuarii]
MSSAFDQYQHLTALVPNEIVTHSLITDVTLPNGSTLALLTLDNQLDGSKPTTLGPATLIELGKTLETQRERARSGEIAALAVTGKPGYLVAGADLTSVAALKTEAEGRGIAQVGHDAYAILNDLGVPTFAFINGVALGGGLEIALAANYRTVSERAKGLGLPEAFIGLVPGWGGVYRLPRLIGPEAALEIMIKNPLNNNRSIDGTKAFEVGLADAIFPADTFVEQSIQWAASVLDGSVAVERPNSADPETKDDDATRFRASIAAGRDFVKAKNWSVAPAPAKVLEVWEAGIGITQPESAVLEVNALSELMQTPQFKSTVYSFVELVQKRGKRPAGAPDASLAKPINKVGVVGAGLMASQLALLFVTQLRVPVVITDMDQARVDKGLGFIHAELDKSVAKGRLKADAASQLKGLVSGSVSKDVYADADFIIEAVFEELSVKKQVFAEVEAVARPDAILATNTSSLSVTAMAEDLKNPERLVGFHFFNPVAVMPLVEVVRAPASTDEVIATAFALAKNLRKTAVLVKDATGFVVNRVLLRLMGEVSNAFDDGTDAAVADHALDPMGLPMTPFTLAGVVGLPVAQHVTESLHATFGDRFRISTNQQQLIDNGVKALWAPDGNGGLHVPQETLDLLTFGDTPSTSEELLTRTQDALAEEIGLLLDEGVVAGPEDVDLCMILGAGWPMHLGGITPYLDRVGASERVNGKKFHPER